MGRPPSRPAWAPFGPGTESFQEVAAFPTRLGALLFASRVNIEGRSPNGVSLARAYRCPTCRKWHLTSRRSRRNDGLPPGTVV